MKLNEHPIHHPLPRPALIESKYNSRQKAPRYYLCNNPITCGTKRAESFLHLHFFINNICIVIFYRLLIVNSILTISHVRVTR